jgi:hypothetical protein
MKSRKKPGTPETRFKIRKAKEKLKKLEPYIGGGGPLDPEYGHVSSIIIKEALEVVLEIEGENVVGDVKTKIKRCDKCNIKRPAVIESYLEILNHLEKYTPLRAVKGEYDFPVDRLELFKKAKEFVEWAENRINK